MKDFFKKIVKWKLRILAHAILKKYKPDVIGVTGSFGKTSTKDAIYTVLSQKFEVRRNVKNFNNEIGLPLTIIGSSSGESSIIGWAVVILRGLLLLAWKEKSYPKILVLEMGVDRPGDMKYLTDLAPCKIGVVANIGSVHLEYFKSIDKIAKEKSVMVSHLPQNGWAILNNDNEHVAEMIKETPARVITYGINNPADLTASEIKISQKDSSLGDGGIAGLSFKLTYKGSTVPVLLPRILGEHLIYAALAGAALGVVYGMNLLEISEALRMFVAPKGRMNLISGIKNTTIIDDTYNASTESMTAALKAFGKIEATGKKYAVLGDMLELGNYTVEAHRTIGEIVVQNGIDILVTVGERARTIAAEVERQGMDSDHVFTFSDSPRAGLFLQDRLEEGDYVLVKGSQGMRMEKIVKEIMAEPLKAKDLLVRQDRVWLNK